MLLARIHTQAARPPCAGQGPKVLTLDPRATTTLTRAEVVPRHASPTGAAKPSGHFEHLSRGCFGLDFDEQPDSGFRCSDSVYQVEGTRRRTAVSSSAEGGSSPVSRVGYERAPGPGAPVDAVPGDGGRRVSPSSQPFGRLPRCSQRPTNMMRPRGSRDQGHRSRSTGHPARREWFALERGWCGRVRRSAQSASATRRRVVPRSRRLTGSGAHPVGRPANRCSPHWGHRSCPCR